MKDKKCKSCGSKLVKFGSNVSCSNLNCLNNISDDEKSIYLKYEYYSDAKDLELNTISVNIPNKYVEDYDDYLYFSDRIDYISRFEYRKMNDFIEDKIFKGNKIKISKRYLKKDEISNHYNIAEKYELLTEGRELEKESHQKALEFYKSLFNNRLFKNDYYLYKKLVIYEKNPEKQLEYIESFFKSGVYCNRYHYLFFLKRLHQLSQKIEVSDEFIDDCLIKFKVYGFKRKKHQDSPVPIAEKITLHHGKLQVKTDEGYALMQFKYEMEEESSNLVKEKQYMYSNEILESLILDKGFRDVGIFKKICSNYRRLGDRNNELKWIFGFFSKGKLYNSNNFWDFAAKLDALNIKTNTFNCKELCFDTNEHYLTKHDFKDNPLEYRDLHDYINLVKFKYSMIRKGRELEKTDLKQAIEYYKSIINHKLFENDYYPYKRLAACYHQMDDSENELETILSFLNSGIYCNHYNYLFFLFNLKRLSQIFVVEDYEINDALKSFKEKSFKNRYLENTPVPLADRIRFRKNELKIRPYEEFNNQQELEALYLELDLYNSCGMLYTVNEILKTLAKNHLGNTELYQDICYNYQEMNDVENELEVIKTFLNDNGGWNFHEEKWFKDRLEELENMEIYPEPLKEPKIEIIYENNDDYLTYDDFKNNDDELTELIDKLNSKLILRRKGWRLENRNYKKAIEFYESLLNHYLFKDDYYIYRKLVIYYEKINEFESMFQTIKSFFNSGINCTRYQYIWFLHKLQNISSFMFISDEEVDECLKNFKEKGFKNKNIEKDVYLSERLYKKYSDLEVRDHNFFIRVQKKYELEEQARQLELNGDERESVKILRNLVESGCNTSTKDYMRLCYMYRRLGDYENELEVINKYLSSYNRNNRDFFEKRLLHIKKFIEN